MLATDVSLNNNRTTAVKTEPAQRLIGYILTSKNYDPGKAAEHALLDRSNRAGFAMSTTEWDIGSVQNPYRVGLWRTLRHLVCNRCEPRRLPFSLVNFDDFIQQALKPCLCGNKTGFDGIVVTKLAHITTDAQKGAALVVALAKRGKHLLAEDGHCLSCCHPATQRLLGTGG